MKVKFNMAHVAVIGLRGIPDVMGGIETHCAQLLKRVLADTSCDELKVTVLARSRYVSGSAVYDGVRQIPLWSPRQAALETIFHTFIALFYARFFMRTDIVHLHAIGPGLLSPLARLMGFRLLFTHHGEDYRRQKWGVISKTALHLGEMLAIRFAHQVITVSPSTAKRLRARYPGRADCIIHIPNGFVRDTVVSATDAQLESYGLTRGRYVIAVARLVPEKGQDLLIEAFKASSLCFTTPPWKLLIVGDSDHESSYSRLLQDLASGDERIVLAGRTSHADVMALNAAAGLFVLPSYHEGLSIAALEAIHAGVPVLLSDIEANRNIGLAPKQYFSSGSAQALAKKLDADPATYVTDDAVDLSRFDWSEIACATLRELKALDKTGSRRRRQGVA